ncbi:DUF2169 family type VI secretion system accessory protein [Desulfonatronum parangueonense]
MHRSFTLGEGWSAVISVSACFALQQRDQRILDFQTLWPTIEAAVARDELFDFGMPKPRGEFLVYGSAWSPNPARALQVQVRVGRYAKSLDVFGNRHWSAGGSPTQPEPFKSMRICSENAFGGPGVPENPQGKGSVADASGFQPLPNIQTPGNLVGAPGDRPFPAGLTAWSMTLPQRMRYMGTVDERYLLENWPAMPRGTNPEYFNTAPEDQRIQGFFQGDEVVEILNMHPERPRITTSLPGVRVRLFIHRIDDGREVFTEVPCRAETVWLFPEQERGILLFRGEAETESEELDDMLHLFARWETLSEPPKPLEHYFSLFQEELQSAQDPQTPPDQQTQEEEPVQASREQAVSDPAATASASAVAGAGTLAAADAMLEQLVREAETLQAQTADMLTKAGLNPDEVFKTALAGESAPESVEMEDINVLMTDLEKQSKDLLARFNVDEQEALKLLEPRPETHQPSVDEIIKELRASGINNPEIEARFLEADGYLKEAAGIVAGLAAQRAQAASAADDPRSERQSTPEAPDEDSSAESEAFVAGSPLNVEQVMAMHAAGQSLARLDLTGLDFSGLDLSRADFTEAVLDRCIFRGANLAGAVFSAAILTAADMTGADLHQANLRDVHASRTSVSKADLKGADLTQGDFAEADLAGADLTGAVLHDAIFEQAGMTGVQARGVQAARAGFMAADLAEADLTEANLEEADFSAANLTRADLTGIIAPELRLHGAQCTETNFRNARLEASRSDQGASFADANLSGADLRQACWDGVDLSGSNLTGAVLDNADFTRTNLAKANLRRASARETNFMKAILDDADLTSINLFKGNLRKASLVNTKLRFSNLYGVDFYKSSLGNADLGGANLKRTLLSMGFLS